MQERPTYYTPNRENLILLCCVVITLLFLILPASFNNWTGFDCDMEGAGSFDFTAGLVGVHMDGETKTYGDMIDFLKENNVPHNLLDDTKDIRDRAHAALAFVVLASVAVLFVSIATVRLNVHPVIQFVAPFFALLALLCWIAAHVGFNDLADDITKDQIPFSCSVKFHICFIAYFFTVASCCLTALLCKKFVDTRKEESEGVVQEGLLALPYESLEGTQ